MKHKLLFSYLFVGLMVVVQFRCSSGKEDHHDTTNKETEVSVEKGSRLVFMIGCNDCHTPKKFTQFGPVLDSSRLLSGFPENDKLQAIDEKSLQPGNWVLFAPSLDAAVGPWGVSFSANITSDSATGIGAWTDYDFVQTMRTGKHLGQAQGRPILPPMPWPAIGKLSDNELKSILMYLKSTIPIKNKVPQPLSPDQVKKMQGKNL